MYKYLLITILTICFASNGARGGRQNRNEGVNDSTLDCISCISNQPGMNEVMKAQKIAQRLEYIKQQLISNLHFETPPKDPPKLETLPGFLVDQLVNTPTENEAQYTEDDRVDTKQIVLFPEEETRNCHPLLKSSLCLTFKLSDGITSNMIGAAAVWLKLETGSQMQNFTIADKSTLNARNRNNRHPKVLRVQESNGWYELDVRSNLLSWQYHKDSKVRSFVISCDDCEFVVNKGKTASSFLLLYIEKEENSRSKRGVDCVPGHTECCRENLEVDFDSLGNYKMILFPTTFNAFMCRGNCYYHSAVEVEKQYATLMVSLKLNKTSHIQLPTTCCTPTKFSSLSVIYATSNFTFEKAFIPNMVVESCGCV